jgi:hypothetical protein
MRVEATHDQWLLTLVALLVESHGTGLQFDDHTGNEVTRAVLDSPPNQHASASTSTP